MNIFDVIHARYSHKDQFLPDPVPLADLEKIALAGLAAPNGVNRQIVRLIILPDRAAIDPISDLMEYGNLRTAPAAIAVLTTNDTPPGGDNFEKEDYSAVVENMLLATVALGYESLWLDHPWFDATRQQKAKEVLGIPQEYHLWATLPIGKPDGPGSRREKMPPEERMFYVKYGQRK